MLYAEEKFKEAFTFGENNTVNLMIMIVEKSRRETFTQKIWRVTERVITKGPKSETF